MIFNIPKIEKIINNIDFNNSEDFYYSAKCWDLWLKDFFSKNNQHEKIDTHLSLTEKIKKLEYFKKNTDASEEAFNKCYPKFKYTKYISPWDYDIKLISENKIKKIAFELQEHIPLKYNQLCHLLGIIYHVKPQQEWTFKTISNQLMSYDKDLYLKSITYLAMKNKKLVA